MRKLIPLLCLAMALGGCATVVMPPSGADSSLIVGALRIDVSGIGTATNGADGMLNTDVPYNAAVFLQSEADGRTRELRTDIPSGFFFLANAEPGTYHVVRLWAQVKTSNAYITITSNFDKSPAFEVVPGHVENLGLIRWSFTFDLTRATSTNTFTFNTEFPAVTDALGRTGNPSVWAGRPGDEVKLSGDVAATPQAIPLQPRGSNRILIP